MQTILRFSKENWGEDRIYADASHFIVVDGSTPIHNVPCEGCNSHAEWMADEFVRFAARILADPQSAAYEDYRDLCAAFIDATRNDPHLTGLAESDTPCFTTAAIYLTDDTLTAYNLCDCSVIIKFSDGTVRRWCDERITAFSDRTLAARAYALSNGLDPAPYVAEQRMKNRAAMNTPGAYWTVAYKGEIKKEFTLLSFPRKEVNSFLICSDGFSRLFEYPGGITIDDVFAPDFDLEQAFSLLRSLEHSSDAPAQVKRSDDVSAILVNDIQNP